MRSAVEGAIVADLQDNLVGVQENFRREHGTVAEIWRRFLEHSFKTVPALSGHRWLGSLGETIRSLPLIDRSHLAARLPQRLSHLSIGQVTNKTTSGSTGLPLTVWFDAPARSHLNGRLYELLIGSWPELAERVQPGLTAVMLISDRHERDELPFVLPMQKYSLFRRATLGDANDQHHILTAIREYRPAILYGKPHCLRRLTDFLCQLDYRQFDVSLIVTAGEVLHTDDVAVFSETFGCPVVDTYAATECGLVACSLSRPDELIVDDRFVVPEVLQNDGTVNDIGSGELVITSRHNWLLPLPRYRTGDFAVLERVNERLVIRRVRRTRVGADYDMTAANEKLVVNALAETGIWDYAFTVANRHAVLQWSGDRSREAAVRIALDRVVASLGIAGGKTAWHSAVTLPGSKRQRFPRA